MRGHDHGAAARAGRAEPPHTRVPEPRGAGAALRCFCVHGLSLRSLNLSSLVGGAAAGTKGIPEETLSLNEDIVRASRRSLPGVRACRRSKEVCRGWWLLV